MASAPAWIRVLLIETEKTGEETRFEGRGSSSVQLRTQWASLGLSGKEAICNAGYVGSVPWGKNWQLTPVFLCVENPMNREAW